MGNSVDFITRKIKGIKVARDTIRATETRNITPRFKIIFMVKSVTWNSDVNDLRKYIFDHTNQTKLLACIRLHHLRHFTPLRSLHDSKPLGFRQLYSNSILQTLYSSKIICPHNHTRFTRQLMYKSIRNLINPR